jgi:NhaA family Na+:H+ antiporter
MKELYNKHKYSILKGTLRILQSPSFGGMLLVLCVILAMLLANSPYKDYYFNFIEVPITISIGPYANTHSLLDIVNDGLMVFFFFLVGLEIKRELLVGHLKQVKMALFPVISAVGGVVMPALLYSVFPHNVATAGGWAIPTATDIAFSLAVLSLISSSVPVGLKVFLTTLAIADDIIGIIIIGVLYTSQLSMIALLSAICLLAFMYLLNKFGVRSTFVYTVLSVLVWIAVAKSGIHPTIAGVLAAMTIPVKPKVAFEEYLKRSRVHFKKLITDEKTTVNTLIDDKAKESIFTIGRLSERALTPLTKMETGLHSFVHYLVLPFFAFVNAGIAFSAETEVFSPVSIGVFVGLFVGKPLGIYCMARLTALLKIASPPSGVSWTHIFGAGVVAGIGFTIAIFMTTLVFAGTPAADSAKIGIAAGSFISAVVGLLILKYAPAAS